MTNRKHTPGPWAAGIRAGDFTPRSTFDVAFSSAAHGALSYTERRKRYDANALLIEAAPDLYDAVVTVLWAAKSGVGVDDLVLEVCQAAINKADRDPDGDQ